MTLLIPTLLLPAAALAGTGFDGTWKTNMDSLKATGKPLVLVLARGEYTCSSCTPPYTVKADGAEHSVGGQAYFDTAKVKVTGPNSAEIVLKQGSKEFVRFSDTVSADGTTLTSKVTNHVGEKTVTDTLMAKRVGAAPANSHPLSGSWQEQQHVGGNLRTVQYRMTAEGFQMRWRVMTQTSTARSIRSPAIPARPPCRSRGSTLPRSRRPIIDRARSSMRFVWRSRRTGTRSRSSTTILRTDRRSLTHWKSNVEWWRAPRT
jgi:hypothetical protein